MLGLYAWGANSHGQLGLGYSCEMVCEPHRVDELPAQLCESAVACIVGGGGHTLLLTTSGTLYGAGWNNWGQVGEGTASRCVPCFRECRGLEGQVMVDAACGWAHSVACSASGHVWVWGSNTHGQLGLPPDEVPFSSLPICLELCDVISVAAGLRHTVVATRSGDVYTWGHGHRGQLGHLSEDGTTLRTLTAPKLLDTLETKVVEVSCGQNMTYAVTSEGAVLAWGDNKWGQLAHDPRNLLFFTCPLTIPSNYFGGERVCWVRAGWTHCVAGTSTGAVYVWGRGDYGQLGPPPKEEEDGAGLPVLGRDHLEDQLEPMTKLEIIKYRYIPSLVTVAEGLKVEQLVCGSEHTLALLSSRSTSAALSHSAPHLSSLPRRPSLPEPQLAAHHHFPPRLLDSTCTNTAGATINNMGGGGGYAISPDTVITSLESIITDSGTVSSASDSGSAHKGILSTTSSEIVCCVSHSPTSDIALEQRDEEEEVVTSLKSFRLNEVMDQPCTLSPIDSPRTMAQQTVVKTVGSGGTFHLKDVVDCDGVKTDTVGRLRELSQHNNKASYALNLPANSGLSAESAEAQSLPSDLLSSSVPTTSMQSINVTSEQQPQHSLSVSSIPSKCSEYPCIYSWGWNEHGNCGLGSTENVTVPRRVPVEGKVLLVAAGSGHSFALIRNYSKVTL